MYRWTTKNRMSRQTQAVLLRTLIILYNECGLWKCSFVIIFRPVMSPDKDQDGSFNWVDKSKIEFSNYSPGWPKNTANLWDCGQIFTGRIRTLNMTLSRVFSWGWHRIIRSLLGNYDGKWETTNCFKSHGYICEMTGGQNPKPTATPGQSDLLVPSSQEF